ncbi:MAG: hypothetical protein C5B60_01765 [Chloroflexi bacterium]|nr:MAG: hypothetical protein C5B60_01765 [Chloroflexota bacterium]
MEQDTALFGTLPGTTNNVDPASAWPVAGTTGFAQGQGVGQHGVSPMTGGIGGMVTGAVTGVWDWLQKPFTTHMAPVDVFLLVGVVIIAAIIWNLVLYHIRIAAEAI